MRNKFVSNDFLALRKLSRSHIKCKFIKITVILMVSGTSGVSG